MPAFRLKNVVALIASRLEIFNVRISSLQNTAQLLSELRAIKDDKLPAVIICFTGLDFNEETMCAEAHLSLVLVDRFHADSDDRAMKLFDKADVLMEYFPLLGKEYGEAFVTPEDMQAASVDPNYAAIVLGLRVQQRAK